MYFNGTLGIPPKKSWQKVLDPTACGLWGTLVSLTQVE